MVEFLLLLAAVAITALVITLFHTMRRLRASQAATRCAREELQQLAHAVSHDLPEPLRAIAGFTGLLQEDYSDQLDQTAQEFLGYIDSSADRMDRMLTGLLEYSRIETLGKSFKRLDPATAVSDAIEKLAETITQSGAEINVNSLPLVLGDDKQIVRLFRHLIDNAIKFAAAPKPLPSVPDATCSTIEVTATRRADGMVEFQIRDHGIGIPKNHREDVFRLFRQLHPRGAYPGAGTGLAICRRIVRRHGGQIWVAPSDLSGTTVCFTLPSA